MNIQMRAILDIGGTTISDLRDTLDRLIEKAGSDATVEMDYSDIVISWSEDI